jgi:hypothetical protein
MLPHQRLRVFRPTPSLLFVLGLPLVAQTYVVDAANGPGAAFTDLPAAVAAVPDGATLIVRTGYYHPFSIIGKGLTIIGETNVDVWDWGNVSVIAGYTAPHQPIVIRGLRFSASLGAVRLHCQDCAGRVVFEDCTADAPTTGGSIVAIHCRELWIERCTLASSDQLYSTLALVDSDATVVSSTIDALVNGRAGVFQIGGTLQLCDSSIAGGGYGPQGAAVSLQGGALRIGGHCTLSGSYYSPAPLGLAVYGTGTARIDPNTTLVRTLQPAYGVGVTVVVETMPALVAATGPLGGAATARLDGPAGTLAALLVGLPGPPVSVPGFGDPFWLQPGTSAVHGLGTLGATPLLGGYPVPNAAWVLGVAIAWQGATFAPATGLQASNPALYVHH